MSFDVSHVKNNTFTQVNTQALKPIKLNNQFINILVSRY